MPASKMAVLLLFAALAGVSAFNADFSDKAWKERPITKVIGLLNDMSAQLQKEAEQDEEMYETMGCWCETNDKEKTKAIADANRRISELTSAIEGYTAKDSQLETEIEKLNAEIAKSTDALAEASAIRAKENAEFQSDEKDMLANGASLGGAVDALGAAHGSAASLSQKSLVQVREVLRHHMKEHSKIFHAMFAPKQHRIIASLLQEDKSADSYEPASGAIFGILKQMKESFETNLDNSRTEEKQAASEFEDMKAAKTAQMNKAEDLESAKSVELGDTKDKNAQAKEDLVDTQKQLAADTKFLETVKSTCATADADYEARQKVRSEEIQAVSETIGILTSDEAQTSFSKSMSFLQMSIRTHRQSSEDQRRERATHLLKQALMKSGDSQLSKIATSLKVGDPMAGVKQSIDEMMAELKKTQKEEADEYDFCTSEIKANDKERKEKTDMKADLETTIADLESLIATHTDDIKMLKAEILNTQVEMKKAGENREMENKDFQVTVADQKATQAILSKALDRLKAFYAGKAMLQDAQSPPPQATYKKSAGSTGVMMMIEGIIKESANVEKDALNAENEAQKSYEEYIADSNASVDAASENVNSKTEGKAKAEKELIAAKDDLKNTIDNLLYLGEHNVALHQQCDFLIKNFEVRQSARAEEIESLFNAKAILSGADYGFLQKSQ